MGTPFMYWKGAHVIMSVVRVRGWGTHMMQRVQVVASAGAVPRLAALYRCSAWN